MEDMRQCIYYNVNPLFEIEMDFGHFIKANLNSFQIS